MNLLRRLWCWMRRAHGPRWGYVPGETVYGHWRLAGHYECGTCEVKR